MAEVRLAVLLEAARSGETVAEVCHRHGICRQTYYRNLGRYQAQGVEGLEPHGETDEDRLTRLDGYRRLLELWGADGAGDEVTLIARIGYLIGSQGDGEGGP